MGMHKSLKMPSPEELKEEMPLSEEAKQIKAARDKEIRDVFTGASDKFLVIIGPCSADNETAVMDYLGRLARVQKDLADKLLIILVFIQTNLVQQVTDTKVWFISQTLRKHQIWLVDFVLSANFIWKH